MIVYFVNAINLIMGHWVHTYCSILNFFYYVSIESFIHHQSSWLVTGLFGKRGASLSLILVYQDVREYQFFSLRLQLWLCNVIWYHYVQNILKRAMFAWNWQLKSLYQPTFSGNDIFIDIQCHMATFRIVLISWPLSSRYRTSDVWRVWTMPKNV